MVDLNLLAPEENKVELNPLYRFENIFGRLFDKNIEDMAQTRELFFDICMHYIIQLDLREGLAREDFYCDMVAAERQYMPDLNVVIEEYHTKENQATTYSQRELEAMFDYSYNLGLRVKKGQTLYDVFVNNEDRVIYYYLRKDQEGAVNVVKKWGSDDRRRLNQMNLFFNPDDIEGYIL